jgi:hypothetical protein
MNSNCGRFAGLSVLRRDEGVNHHLYPESSAFAVEMESSDSAPEEFVAEGVINERDLTRDHVNRTYSQMSGASSAINITPAGGLGLL